MNIVVASGAFKYVYNQIEACNLIRDILTDCLTKDKEYKIDILPIADGGEYTAEVLKFYNRDAGLIKIGSVVSPMGTKRSVNCLGLGEKVFISSFDALDLTRESAENLRNPLCLTSYGFGQLIKKNLDQGKKKIILGLGGTTTVDGGLGLAQALLGYDSSVYWSGKDLSAERLISNVSNFDDVEVDVLCDGNIPINEIDIPIEQKIDLRFSASERKNIKEKLFKGIKNYAFSIQDLIGEDDILNKRYYGVAGGMLLSLKLLFKNLKIFSGFDYIFSGNDDFERVLKTADLIITAEGRLDNSLQSVKGPVALCKKAKKMGKKTLYLCGDIHEDFYNLFKGAFAEDLPKSFTENGIDKVLSLHHFFKSVKIPVKYEEKIRLYKQYDPLFIKEAFDRYLLNIL